VRLLRPPTVFFFFFLNVRPARSPPRPLSAPTHLFPFLNCLNFFFFNPVRCSPHTSVQFERAIVNFFHPFSLRTKIIIIDTPSSSSLDHAHGTPVSPFFFAAPQGGRDYLPFPIHLPIFSLLNCGRPRRFNGRRFLSCVCFSQGESFPHTLVSCSTIGDTVYFRLLGPVFFYPLFCTSLPLWCSGVVAFFSLGAAALYLL